MGLFSSGGLFGLGGMGGGAMPGNGLLDGYLDTKAMKKAQLKSLLTNAGISMMAQGPSDRPINFMTSLGQGLGSGVQAAQQTGNDYRDMAMKGYDMQTRADEQTYQRGRDATADGINARNFDYNAGRDKIADARQGRADMREQSAFDEKQKQRKALDLWIGTLSPEQQAAARANPEEASQQFLQSAFNPKGSANGIYGNVYWGPDGKPYGLNKDGSGMKILPIEGGGALLAPPEMAGAKATATATGKDQGENVALLHSMNAKMPGLEKVVSQLDALADRATYTGAGQLYNEGRKQLGMAPSDGAVARTEYGSIVANQILPLLRDTFGAQFTAAEGERLLATLGNPDVTPPEKKAVLRSFISQKKRDIEGLSVQTGQSQPAGIPQPQGGNQPVSDEDLVKMYGG